MQQKLKVIRVEDNGYMLDEYVVKEGGEVIPDPRIVGLFGTHSLPTPFLLPTTVEQVIGVIQELNPDALVTSATGQPKG